MQQQLSFEDSMDSVLTRLEKLAEQPTIQMQQNADGTYQAPQNTKKYDFGEQILDTRSSTSLLGEAVGAAAGGSIYGLITGFLPQAAAIPAGLGMAALGWGLGKFLFKGGFLHAASRGMMITGIAGFIAPMIAGTIGAVAGR